MKLAVTSETTGWYAYDLDTSAIGSGRTEYEAIESLFECIAERYEAQISRLHHRISKLCECQENDDV